MSIDIQIDKGLSLDADSQKRALKAVGATFIKECRLVLNRPGASQDASRLQDAQLPHNVTGLLSRSLRFKVTVRKGDVFVRISANTRYATPLFAGGRHGAARDLFAYVMNKLKPRLNQIITDAIQLE
ncbi:hypothetical protein [Gluconobacter sp. OJB]|uniref:hypothetical protein n=1 Tax=Gluconobacter sp. OJB TaxID=3145196 RepID=UPI0031F90E42